MCATLRAAFLIFVTAATLTACEKGPKDYEDCMLQASRQGKNDRQFRRLAEECKEQFRNKK
jgi:hypothetical protein